MGPVCLARQGRCHPIPHAAWEACGELWAQQQVVEGLDETPAVQEYRTGTKGRAFVEVEGGHTGSESERGADGAGHTIQQHPVLAETRENVSNLAR